jgi:hypothetical protein
MRLHSMLLGGLMIALRMMHSCRMVSLCCVLVMFRCLLVRVVCHKSPCLKHPFCYSREATRRPYCPHLCRIKISRKFRAYHPRTLQFGEVKACLPILETLLLNLPICGI